MATGAMKEEPAGKVVHRGVRKSVAAAAAVACWAGTAVTEGAMLAVACMATAVDLVRVTAVLPALAMAAVAAQMAVGWAVAGIMAMEEDTDSRT